MLFSAALFSPNPASVHRLPELAEFVSKAAQCLQTLLLTWMSSKPGHEPAVLAQVSLQTLMSTLASGKEQSNMLKTSSKLCSSRTGRRGTVCLSGSRGILLGEVMPTA